MRKVAICGKNQSFTEFIKRVLGPEDCVTQWETPAQGAAYALAEQADVLMILPDYDMGVCCVRELTLEEMELLAALITRKQTRLYLENYPNNSCLYETRQMLVRSSLCLSGSWQEALGFALLQKRNGFYFPYSKAPRPDREVLLEIKNCLGVHTVIQESGQTVGEALVHTGNVFYASVDLTNLQENYILPYAHWCRFYGKLFSQVLGVSEEAVVAAFRKSYGRITTQGALSTAGTRKQRLEQGVHNAIQWHLHSGVMRKADGSAGVFEMIRSFDLNCLQRIRGDSSLFTAALFAMAGKYFEKAEYREIADNIVRYSLVEQDLQIMEGENRGLFRWFSGIMQLNTGAHYVYSTDTCRCGNCLCALYQITGEAALKDRILALGEAILRWFHGNALLPIGYFNYDTDDLETLQKLPTKTTAPEMYEPVLLFLKNIYSLTGDDRYRRQLLDTAAAMAAVHPDYQNETAQSKNFRLSRLLGCYAAAQTFGDGPWTPIIHELLMHFRQLQHPCGGFAEAEAYFDEASIYKDDMEFAVGFGPEYGNIADLMYCQNTMAYVLNILSKCSGSIDVGLCRAMRDSCLEFLLNTQLVSRDQRLSGGWMRAYDMDLEECFGCDKDSAWGAYSILTGWMTGAIPMVFLDRLGLPTIY